MEFISAREFSNQPKEVQEVFMEWWKPSMGDLFCDIDAFFMEHMGCLLETDKIEIINDDKKHGYYIPLFTEGQLRKFIEDKTGGLIQVESYTTLVGLRRYCVRVTLDGKPYNATDDVTTDDLLQAYWKVALEIAKESVKSGL